MKNQNYIVAFHISRGGSFNNQGHKSYNSFVSNFQELIRYESDHLFFNNEDEEGDILPEEEWTMTDGSGNIMLQGREEIESPVGELSFDGDYDTDIVKYVEECDEEELDILYQAYKDGEYFSSEVEAYICEQNGYSYIEDVIFYSDNALVVLSSGDNLTFFWDGEDDVTEADAKEWLTEHGVDIRNAEKWADSFVAHFYND